MFKKLILVLAFLNLWCISRSQSYDRLPDIDSLAIKLCKIVKIKHHKSVYDIHATVNDLKIRILSTKEKCRDLEKIKKGREYKIVLKPYFDNSDSIMNISIPDFVLVNNISIPVNNGFSPDLFFGLNLHGLYYTEIEFYIPKHDNGRSDIYKKMK